MDIIMRLDKIDDNYQVAIEGIVRAASPRLEEYITLCNLSYEDVNVDHAYFIDLYSPDLLELANRQYYYFSGLYMVGTITAWHGNGEGRIHWLAVHPDFRRRGIGTSLLRTALNRFREIGYTSCWLDTQDHRKDAIRLYMKYGFKRS